MNASPLGRFSEFTATIVAIAIAAAWLLVHLGLTTVTDTAAIDNVAIFVFGVVLGQRATTNGAGKIAAVANARIDELERRFGVTLRPSIVPEPPPADGGG